MLQLLCNDVTEGVCCYASPMSKTTMCICYLLAVNWACGGHPEGYCHVLGTFRQWCTHSRSPT